MFTQSFDDGSTATFDSAGNPVGYTDYTGRSFQADTSGVSQLLTSIFGSLSRALNQKLVVGPQVQQQQQYALQASALSQSGMFSLALVAGGGFLAYTLVKSLAK